MKILIVTLDSTVIDQISNLLKDKFSISDIRTIESYEQINQLINDSYFKVDIIFIDNLINFQGELKSVLQRFTMKHRNYINSSASQFIFLSKDKKEFLGLAQFQDNVKTIHLVKSSQSNTAKIKFVLKELGDSVKFRKFLKEREKIYFIHGFSGDQSTWENLTKLMNEDTDCKELFDIDYYNYPSFSLNPTKLLKIWIPRKYDSLYNNARSLDSKIKSDNPKRIIIVAHSLGGLIVRQFLLTFFLSDYRKKLDKVILFSPAHNGSRLANILSILYRKNPHLKILAKNNPQLKSLKKDWKKSGIEGKIYIKAIVGLRDKTLDIHSSSFGLKETNIETVNDKGHLDIKNPGSINSQTFKMFKRHLMS